MLAAQGLVRLYDREVLDHYSHYKERIMLVDKGFERRFKERGFTLAAHAVVDSLLHGWNSMGWVLIDRRPMNDGVSLRYPYQVVSPHQDIVHQVRSIKQGKELLAEIDGYIEDMAA